METAQHVPKTHRWSDHALIGLFVLSLLLPLLDFAFHLDPTSAQSENRLLAPLPRRPTKITGIQNFISGWEAYFCDHFGCRRVLVMWHNKLKWSLFKNQDTRRVLLGTDGWLFTSGDQMIEHYCGARQFTESDLNNWQKLLEHRRDWLAQHDIKYLFVIAPDKHSIYPEQLPVWLKDLGGQTKTDEFFAHMKVHSTVTVLDLRPALRAAKQLAPLYQKTDTHWNQFGAFMACQELVRVLARQLPGLTPLALDAFYRTNKFESGGDLAKLLGISMTESNEFLLTPKPGLPALEKFVPTGQHYKEMAFSKCSKGCGLAFVYQESFGRFWVPFLGYQFGEVDYYWQYNLDSKTIEQKKPVVVVDEMLERYFTILDPKKLFMQDALP